MSIIMDLQQLVTYGIVGIALVYLVRRAIESLRSFIEPPATTGHGCAGGCGKCEFARPGGIPSASKPNGSMRIALQDIKVVGSRKDAG